MHVSGDHSVEATPDSIPNSVVKLHSADGTAGETLWESRTSPGSFSPRLRDERRRGFFLGARTSLTPLRFNDSSVRMLVHPQGSGWIEVICGPMFSGKTEELIRRLRRAHYARQRAEVFKPHIDRRFSESEVVSHSAQRVEATPVEASSEILQHVSSATEVVAIDEAQFFTSDVVGVAEDLANRGVRVIVAGLDTDYRGEPFEPVPALMARAEYVTKLLAICVRCGRPANRTLRVSRGEARIEVGAAERYEAVCRTCHEEAGRRPMQPGSS